MLQDAPDSWIAKERATKDKPGYSWSKDNGKYATNDRSRVAAATQMPQPAAWQDIPTNWPQLGLWKECWRPDKKDEIKDKDLTDDTWKCMNAGWHSRSFDDYADPHEFCMTRGGFTEASGTGAIGSALEP